MKNNIGKFWNSDKIVAEFRDAPIQEYWYEFFKNILNKNSVEVLDMGCGGGRYTEMFSALGFDVYAFDLHEKMVEATKEKLKSKNLKANVQQADMLSLPFENEQFDYILSNGLFHNAQNLNDLEKALNETNRVLKPSGVLCLNMFYDADNFTKLTKKPNKIYITQDNTPMTLLKLDELINLLKKNSFLAQSEIITYTREMEVGIRDVMRGIFKKTS